jgi:acetate kinase
MKILVLNCGSSSLKYQLFDMADESVLAKGLVERIGIAGSRIKHTKGSDDSTIRETDIPDHTQAIKLVLELLLDAQVGVLKNLQELSAVGHRIVHGGEKYADSALVTETVIKGIEECSFLAPLHNPANLMGVHALQKALPGVPNVVVFDTAFHQTMPPKAFIYGVPYEYYERDKVRRYSFHGTSHAFVSARAAEILGRPIESLKLITCHLGNGSSITAVDAGKSVDASMGMGTTAGVLMGTRCGDVDGSVFLYLMEKIGDVGKMSDLIHKQSGLLGISGISSDLRDVEEAANKGNSRAKLASEILYMTVKKYIASYAAVMGGVDAVVFTAGIGENSATARREAATGLEFMGIKLDEAKNKATRGSEAIISAPDSRVKVLVVPTNEELMIARDTKRLAK